MVDDEMTGGRRGGALIALLGPADFGSGLKASGHTLLRIRQDVEDANALSLPAGTQGLPRLTIVAAGAGAPSRLDHVRALHRRWPLVDTLVCAPDASPEEVRDLLRAGARDVVLEAGTDALCRAIDDTLGAQQILPLVDDLATRRVRSSRFEGMLSRSHAMWDVFETCARVAPTDANILIAGETGTGKELLARAVHRRSERKGRFVAVDCSSLPEALVESELFGHEKGAFTGAARAREGIFRHAEGGTVFLDEIGDMTPTAQQRLLRVLEERTVRPVGGSEELPVDLRIVAATHVPLEEAVAEGRFREDLFYRIDVIRLDIPPLRERPEDVVYLFGHFVKSLAKHYGLDRPELRDAFLARLARYPWPGNVRELENFAERVVLRTKGGRPLTARDFQRLVRPAEEPTSTPRLGAGDDAGDSEAGPAAGSIALDLDKGLEETLRPVVEQTERRYLEALLAKTGGRMQEAARHAGISRRTLQRKLTAYEIDRSDFREKS